MPLLAGCIFSLQGFVLPGATGPPWWPYEATGWKVWDDYSFSRLVGKLKLMARKVVEPIMAVLTLRSSPPWIEMPRAQVSHPQLQRGLLPHGGERLPLESVYGVCVWGGGCLQFSLPQASPPFLLPPSTKLEGRALTLQRLSTASPFEGSGFREVEDGNQCHHSADGETGAAGLRDVLLELKSSLSNPIPCLAGSPGPIFSQDLSFSV